MRRLRAWGNLVFRPSPRRYAMPYLPPTVNAFGTCRSANSSPDPAPRLPNEARAQLNRSRPIRLAVDHPERRRPRAPLHVRRAERRMVHHVEEFEAKLQVRLLRDHDPLQQRRIPFVDAVRPYIREGRGERPDMIRERIRRIRIEQ